MNVAAAPPDPGAFIHDAESDPLMIQRLMEAQKMESVGQLAAGLAHDFNNLLCIIMDHADFVLQDDPHPLHQMEIEQILGAAERGRNLVRQMLAFARGQTSAARQDVSLGPIVEDVLAMVRGSLTARIAVSTRLDPHAGQVSCDRGRLALCLPLVKPRRWG